MYRTTRNNSFWDFIFGKESWLAFIYILISFPLSIVYFTLLVTFISLGFGLLITLLGIPILIGVLVMVRGFRLIDISLMRFLLGLELDYRSPSPLPPRMMDKLRFLLKDQMTWKGMMYFLMKFVIDTFSFSVSISVFAAALGCIATPFFFEEYWYDAQIGNFMIDSWNEAILIGLAGVFLLILSLFIFRILGNMYRELGRNLLGPSETNRK